MMKRSNYADPVLAISLENCYYLSLPEVFMPHKMNLQPVFSLIGLIESKVVLRKRSLSK